MPAFGASYATWNDPRAGPRRGPCSHPSPVPLANVATGWVTNGNIGDFTINVTLNGVTSNAVTVDASAQSLARPRSPTRWIAITGSSPSVPSTWLRRADRTPSRLNFTAGTPVGSSACSQSSGAIKAYVFFYFTGNVMPCHRLKRLSGQVSGTQSRQLPGIVARTGPAGIGMMLSGPILFASIRISAISSGKPRKPCEKWHHRARLMAKRFVYLPLWSACVLALPPDACQLPKRTPPHPPLCCTPLACWILRPEGCPRPAKY